MMKKVKLIFVMVAGLSFTMPAFAAEPLKTTIGADLVSSYLWRGQRLDSFSIQPSVGLEWNGLSLDAWGSTGLTGTFQEIDMTLSYKVGGFTVGLTDYFSASAFSKYFQFGEDTLHVLEGNLGYDFGFMSVNWFTNFLGAVGVTPDGNKAYSSYFELEVPFTLGGLDWSFAAGATPWANDYYGANGFAVVNCSLKAAKDLTIGSLTIPAFVQLMANPSIEGLYICAGISF